MICFMALDRSKPNLCSHHHHHPSASLAMAAHARKMWRTGTHQHQLRKDHGLSSAWAQTSHFTSLILSFPVCRVGQSVASTSQVYRALHEMKETVAPACGSAQGGCPAVVGKPGGELWTQVFVLDPTGSVV